MENLGPIIIILLIAVVGLVVLWFIKRISSLLLTIISGILVVFIVIMLFMIVSDIANKPVEFKIINKSYVNNSTGIFIYKNDPLMLSIVQDGATNISIDKITETAGDKLLVVITYQSCNASDPVDSVIIEIPNKYKNYTYLLKSTQIPCKQ